MTAKEQLLQRVTRLSEAEAEETLRLLEAKEGPPHGLLDDAPPEDEEIPASEESAVQEARDELAAGAATIPFEEIKSKYGLR